MKKMKKSALAAAVLLSLSMMGSVYAATTGTAVSVGQKINFGNYWQSYKGSGAQDSKDNYNKDTVTWRVLAYDGSNKTVTLLSDKALYADAFDGSSNVWSTSEINATLNGDFKGDAFTSAEQGLIVEKTYAVKDGGGNTKELSVTSKLYLLDYNDVKDSGTYGFSGEESRKAQATEFAQNVKVYGNDKSASVVNDNASWWLRSPGASVTPTPNAWVVINVGDNIYARNVSNNGDYAVRPALDLNLQSIIYTSAAEGGKSGATAGSAVKFGAIGTDSVVDVTLRDTSNTYTSAITASTLALDGSNVKMTLAGGTMTDDNYFASAKFDASESGSVVDTAYLIIKKGGGSALSGKQTMNIGGSLISGKEYSLQLANEYHLGDGSIYYATTTDIKGAFSVNSGNVNYKVSNGESWESVSVGGTNTLEVEQTCSIGTVNFASGSTLKVDGEKVKATAAITGITSATVESGAKLYVANAVAGQQYKILQGSGINLSSWTTDATMGDGFKATYGLVVDSENTTAIGNGLNAFVIQFKEDDGVAASGSIIPNVVEARDGELEQFVNDLSDTYGGDTDKVNEQINAMANMGENLGVSRGAYDVANMVGNAVTEHWDNNAKGENIWAVYTRNKTDVDGMELGGMDANYESHYNGVVVGADLSKGFGIALNYADGNVSNGFGGHNDAKYYGGSIYGRKVFGNWNLFGDLTYTHGKNELAQNGIEADAKTDTISAGLTAKYLAKAGKYDKIGLFAGARYMHIDGRDYTDSLGVNREADKINSVVVPVGLEYTGEFKMPKSDWTWKPVLAVGYLFNLGDRSNDMTMSYNGAKDTFGYDFVDKGAFFTHAGMDFENKNFTLGISYDFMKSKNSKNNRWNVNANVAF